MATIDESTFQSVSNANLKNVAEAPAFYSAMAMGNAVAHQNRLQLIAEASVATVVKRIGELDATEALAVHHSLEGDQPLAAQIAALTAAVQSTMPRTPSA